MKNGLLHAHRPAQARFERIGEAIRVLRDDGVPLLQAQHALCFDTERAHALALAFMSASHTAAGAAIGHVDLEPQRRHEAGAHHARRDARHVALAHAEMRKRRLATGRCR